MGGVTDAGVRRGPTGVTTHVRRGRDGHAGTSRLRGSDGRPYVSIAIRSVFNSRCIAFSKDSLLRPSRSGHLPNIVGAKFRADGFGQTQVPSPYVVVSNARKTRSALALRAARSMPDGGASATNAPLFQRTRRTSPAPA